jgi:hypothetical protein
LDPQRCDQGWTPKDFSFSNGRSREFQKTGPLLTEMGSGPFVSMRMRAFSQWRAGEDKGTCNLDNESRPAIGPLPDGSDPSLSGFRFGAAQAPIFLRRASR